MEQDNGRVAAVIAELSPLDIVLLLGKADTWGSWMFDSAMHMVRLGLGREDHGSIKFDTPLAKAVIAYLLSDSDSGAEREDASAAEAVGPQSGDTEGGASPNPSSRSLLQGRQG